jgi:hypothetical protein
MPASGVAEAGHHIGRLGRSPSIGGHQQAGVVVEDVENLHPGPTGEFPVGEVACHRSLGWSASNRMKELRGRFWG